MEDDDHEIEEYGDARMKDCIKIGINAENVSHVTGFLVAILLKCFVDPQLEPFRSRVLVDWFSAGIEGFNIGYSRQLIFDLKELHLENCPFSSRVWMERLVYLVNL